MIPESGGIQAYSYFLLDGLAQIGTRLSSFSRNDSPGSLRRIQHKKSSAHAIGSPFSALRSPLFAGLTVAHALFHRPHLIVTTHLNFGPLAFHLRRRLNIPYIVSLHGIEAWGLGHSKRRRALREADLLLPVSRHTRDRVMEEQQIPSDRFAILSDTFDETRFEIGPKPNTLLTRHRLAPDQPIILTLGRLDSQEAYKGHDRIIQSLPAVIEKIPDVHYIIAGDGDDRSRLERLAEELRVQENVTFAGRVPEAELVGYFQLCDLFAMPSTGEGFGIVFLEALACGKPVLAGNCDGSTDPLADGELGLLVDPTDTDAISKAIVGALRKDIVHPILFKPHELREEVIRRFGRVAFRKRLEEVLRPLLKQFGDSRISNE